MGRIRFRLPGFAEQKTPEIAPTLTPLAIACVDPLKKSAQPVLLLFGAPNGKPKEGFAWEETKGIE